MIHHDQNHQLDLPHAVILDIDGTIALHGDDTNPRGHFEYDKCGGDFPNYPIIGLVRALIARGVTMLVVTGRPDSHEQLTRSWMGLHVFEERYRHLVVGPLMRKTGDRRKDYVIKREIYDEHIAGRYNIMFAIDDRDQVVNMWRNDVGITCIQVADGSF